MLFCCNICYCSVQSCTLSENHVFYGLYISSKCLYFVLCILSWLLGYSFRWDILFTLSRLIGKSRSGKCEVAAALNRFKPPCKICNMFCCNVVTDRAKAEPWSRFSLYVCSPSYIHINIYILCCVTLWYLWFCGVISDIVCHCHISIHVCLCALRSVLVFWGVFFTVGSSRINFDVCMSQCMMKGPKSH